MTRPMDPAAGSDLPCVDAHCHAASEDFIPRSFIDGAVANFAAALDGMGVGMQGSRVREIYLQKLQDPWCDELVADMTTAGIARAALLIPDFTYRLKDCRLTIEEIFLRHREILRRHPDTFVVFGGVDPRWGVDGVDLFERSITELGFRGLKVYPPCGFTPSDRSMFPYYELCARHRLPVVVHIGPTSPVLDFDTAHPFMLDAAAREFPQVPFILAHGAVSFVEESVMMCAFRPNVYLDTSGYLAGFRGAGAAGKLAALASRGINHKILFGTDWPVFRLHGTQTSVIEALRDPEGPFAAIGARDRQLILRANFERVMGNGDAGGT